MADNTARRGVLANMRTARLNAEGMGHELGRWRRYSPPAHLHTNRCVRCHARVYVSSVRFSGRTPVFPCNTPH